MATKRGSPGAGADAKGPREVAAIEVPQGLLEWASKDRCTVKIADEKDAKAKARALREIVRQWVAAL